MVGIRTSVGEGVKVKVTIGFFIWVAVGTEVVVTIGVSVMVGGDDGLIDDIAIETMKNNKTPT